MFNSSYVMVPATDTITADIYVLQQFTAAMAVTAMYGEKGMGYASDHCRLLGEKEFVSH